MDVNTYALWRGCPCHGMRMPVSWVPTNGRGKANRRSSKGNGIINDDTNSSDSTMAPVMFTQILAQLVERISNVDLTSLTHMDSGRAQPL